MLSNLNGSAVSTSSHRLAHAVVEIIRGDKTSQDTMDNLSISSPLFGSGHPMQGQPGFVVNAVIWPYFMDALDFLEKGNAIEKVDRAFVEFGCPGPIKLIDEVGIDVSYNVVKGRGLEQETLKNVVELDAWVSGNQAKDSI